jgi:molybdopterin-guanine dinucleotide biosynthesis protein A
MSPLWAVVLAGGASTRFGSDKLDTLLGEQTVLEHAVRGLPPGTRVVVVGPVRPGLAVDRPIRYVREDPPRGGPAAAMVAGLRVVLGEAAPGTDATIVVLPGDAPAAGRAAELLIEVLLADPAVAAAVGVDLDGREQPLQLALRRSAAERLITAAGPDAGCGASARALVRTLGNDLRRVPLIDDLHADIDTPADLERWRRRPP